MAERTAIRVAVVAALGSEGYNPLRLMAGQLGRNPCSGPVLMPIPIRD